MAAEWCVHVWALLTRLFTKFQDSTYYIAHNANG